MGPVRLIRTASLLLLFVLASPALAWAQEDGAGVIILKFDTFDTSPEVVKTLATTLEEEVAAHPDMHVKPGGELTAKDLALSAGCAKPDETCMKMLRDFVDADRVIFGTVQVSDDVHLFTIRMFDFAESRFVGEVTEATVQGDAAHIQEVIPALVEGVLYGKVGTLTVDVTGADSPELLFDGEKLGLAPTTLENLPLGEHVVTLRADGEELSQSVVLRRGEPANLSFQFAGTTGGELVATGGAETEERPSMVPGIAALGVGVIGLAVGGFGSLQVVDAENKNEDLGEFTDGDAFRSPADRDAALEAGLNPSDIDQQGRTYQTVQFVGYGIGIVGIGLGTFLLIRAMGSETAEASAALPFDFDVAPSKDGVSASMRLRF